MGKRFPVVFEKPTGKARKRTVKGSGMRGLIYELATAGFGSVSELKQMKVYDFFDILAFHRNQLKAIEV